MTTEQYIKLGKLTTIVSFIAGTIIFILELLNVYVCPSSNFFSYGYLSFEIILLINITILILLIIRMIKDKQNRKKLIYTSLLMLINVPISGVYISILFFIFLINA